MTKQTVKAKPKSLRGIENCHVVEIGVEKFAEYLLKEKEAIFS